MWRYLCTAFLQHNILDRCAVLSMAKTMLTVWYDASKQLSSTYTRPLTGPIFAYVSCGLTSGLSGRILKPLNIFAAPTCKSAKQTARRVCKGHNKWVLLAPARTGCSPFTGVAMTSGTSYGCSDCTTLMIDSRWAYTPKGCSELWQDALFDRSMSHIM